MYLRAWRIRKGRIEAMKEKRNTEPTFIPCGDSVEKMEEIKDEQLENISGGAVDTSSLYEKCPFCGGLLIRRVERGSFVCDYMCQKCGIVDFNPWQYKSKS